MPVDKSYVWCLKWGVLHTICPVVRPEYRRGGEDRPGRSMKDLVMPISINFPLLFLFMLKNILAFIKLLS